MKKKTTKKTAATAAPKPTEVPPAFDCNGESVLNWLEDTPEYEYLLMIWPPEECDNNGDPVQEIRMSRVEFIELKAALATMREPGKTTEPVSVKTVDKNPGPDWMKTPEFDYRLEVWDADRGGDQNIGVSRVEFISLKRHLVTLRQSKRAA